MASLRKDNRIRRRNESARVVERPEEMELTRIPSGASRDGQIKAAVLASILLGQPESQIAEQYNLPKQTVIRWKEAFDITSPVNRRDRLSEDILIFLQQEIKNLISISIATSDEEWIKDQTASELAAYVNTKNSVILKVLEAFGKASDHAEKLRVQELELNQIEED